MSTNTDEQHNEVPSESDVSLQESSILDNKSIDDDDSDSPSPERPTSLFLRPKYDDTISVDDSLENERYFWYCQLELNYFKRFNL